MKINRYFWVFLSMTVLFLFCSCSPFVESYSKPDLQIERGRLGIMPFSSNIPEAGKVVSDTIGANLLASGFNIVDRTHLGKILQEQGISYLEIDYPDYNKIGEMAEVDFLLVGNIAFSSATVRLIDASTGEALIITVFRPNKIADRASAVDMGEYIAKSLSKELTNAGLRLSLK